jgi:cell division protein FtsQ
VSRAPARHLKRKPQAKRPAKRVGMLDRALAALPVSEETLRKAATGGILTLSLAVLIFVGSWFGIPGAVGTAVAEGVGRAGFRVDEVEVTGVKRMDYATVYAIATEQQSRAMPLVDIGKVRERLLDYGWIAEARVARRLPNTLVIDVVERSPAAIWQNNGQLMLIDAAGVLLEPVSPSAMPPLPLVIGDGAYAEAPAYQRLLEAAPALKPRIRAAVWIGDRRWDLLFESGERLQLPEGEAPARNAVAKFAELDGKDRLLGRGYVRFDMRDPAKLVVRLPGSVVRTKDVGQGA